MFKTDGYLQRNEFQSLSKYLSLVERVHQQKLICEAHRDMKIANNMFQNALEKSENIDMDAVYDALDLYKSVMSKIHEKEVELEAIAAANLGKIFYKGLSKNDKAKTYYRDSIRLLETLKPKVFTEFRWHQLMMKHMDEITKAEKLAEDNSKSEEEMAMRKSLKKEIDELWDAKDAGPRDFLKLMERSYPSYHPDKEVTFTEDELKESNLRKTLVKLTMHYHPDKKTLSEGRKNWEKKDFYLRDEIIKIINSLTSDMKGAD